MAEGLLSAYNPTWRDKLAQWMMGNAKASPEKRAFVGGILGSTGLGSVGPGLVDATPVGGLLGAQEAAQAGDPKGMAMAMLPMPARMGGRFGGAVMSPVDELFHGSPVAGLSALKASERGPLGPGVYASTSPSVAKRYGENVYNVPHDGLDIYRGEGSRTDAQYLGFKDDKRRLIEALPNDKRAELEPMIEKMWHSDGYPFYQRLRIALGGDDAAQELFKKAGFHGISGQIDGPETLIFSDFPVSVR